MIRVTALLENGLPQRVDSTGHALRGSDTENAACAVVSVLLKSLGMALVEQTGFHVQVEAPREGELHLKLLACDEPDRLAGLWDLTRLSLQEAAAAWPQDILFEVEEA